MKIHTYLFLILIAVQPSSLLKGHSYEPSAPTLEKIEENKYAPSAPSKEEFDPEELQEATRRSLEDQNNEFEIDTKSKVSIGVVIMLILIYLNVLAKSDK